MNCRHIFQLTLALLCFALHSAPGATPWKRALPGWQYAFPRDHHSHPGFKTEWWYFTGNVAAPGGNRFGYQLTFFRQGIRPPAAPGEPVPTSRFIVDDFKFAHFAVSDPRTGRFRYFQKASRGAFGEAGFSSHERGLAWIDDWSLKAVADDRWEIRAAEGDVAIDFQIQPEKPWVTHGADGISRKAAGDAHASHYYSGTRLRTTGRLTIGGRVLAVEGTSWFDHEWASNQLAPGQAGWDWFSIHFGDRTELMLYQMRLADGRIDPASSGTFIAADGSTVALKREDYQLTPRRWWTSKATGARYPVAWTIEIPRLQLRAEVTTPLENQELQLSPIAYWEGMIDVRGERAGARIEGQGYLEMTGYAGALVGLSQER